MLERPAHDVQRFAGTDHVLLIPVAAATLAVMLCTAALGGTESIPTRFGTLTLQTSDDGVLFEGRLLYEGKPLHPNVRGNSALYENRTFRLPDTDVVLFEDVGGTACPSLWYLVTVSRTGASSTYAFGSCGDLIAATQRGRTITVKTRGYLGPFESEAARAKASEKTHTYVFRVGVVTENGKPVPCAENCT